ncbi:MAG: alpha/beta hydrolase [Pseudomonadota bacterium]
MRPLPGHLPAAPVIPGAAPWDLGLALEAEDGVALRAALWNPGGPRGLALYLSGRTEFLEKGAMVAAALAARGYAVASLDWRGQGLSERLTPERMRGHVDSFDAFSRDLAALLAAPEVAREGPVRLAVCHSMGCAIALGAVAAGMLAPGALVLSGPMAGIGFPWIVDRSARVASRLARAAGLAKRWPPMPNPSEVYVLRPFEGNCLTHDPALYGWQGDACRAVPDLGLGLPTLGWVAAAYDRMAMMRRLKPLPLPVQVLLGTREGVVSPVAARALATRLDARLDLIEGAKHDLFTEATPQRDAVWQAIDGFLERLPPREAAAR